ncbi:zinc carboxypeptidase-like [Anthonomus grandis grandis]|uniref:zinc carboxypeptidase-like n=1 Tax=Anthonomus grandis grandis TaxID=2921223 RepID=UPI0021653490|nr:zinc carboxypeptidase-like [Anthonomus grandis grandis]
MKLFYLIFLAILSQDISAKPSYKNYKVYKITPKSKDALKILKDLKKEEKDFSAFQFWKKPIKVGHDVALMIGPEIQQNFEQMLNDSYFDRRVLMKDVQKAIDNENRFWKSNVKNSVNWTVYNTLDEINNWLESLATEFPSYITILKPGKTYEGRDIVGVKLDFNPGTQKKVVFMESNIHAREWISSAVNTYILDQFLRNTQTDIRALAQKFTWYFFPVMNPDGFVFSHTDDRLWRKTRTSYGLHYGADPNRNWDYKWMTNNGASLYPGEINYAGPHPFSEKSVKVMSEFIASITSNMIAYIAFHSFSQVLLLPYGHTKEPLDNYNEMMGIAKVAMAKLEAVHNTKYTFGNVGEEMYIATGTSMDWVKGNFHIPIVCTYELRPQFEKPGESGFILPSEQILPTGEETLVSLIPIFEEYEKLHPST